MNTPTHLNFNIFNNITSFIKTVLSSVDKSIWVFISGLILMGSTVFGTITSLNIYNHAVMNIDKFKGTAFEFQAKLMNLDLQTHWHVLGIITGSVFAVLLMTAFMFLALWATNHDDN